MESFTPWEGRLDFLFSHLDGYSQDRIYSAYNESSLELGTWRLTDTGENRHISLVG